MNITTINSVSFTGKWKVNDVPTKSSTYGGSIGTYYYKRIHTYHPDANEIRTQIQTELAEKQKQFNGSKKRTKIESGPDTTDIFTNIVKLGKRLLSAKKRTELVAEQKALNAQKVTISRKLQAIAKKLALK